MSDAPEFQTPNENPRRIISARRSRVFRHFMVVSVFAPVLGGIALGFLSPEMTLTPTQGLFELERTLRIVALAPLLPLVGMPWCIPLGLMSYMICRHMAASAIVDPLVWVSAGTAFGMVSGMAFAVGLSLGVSMPCAAWVGMCTGAIVGAVLRFLWVDICWQFTLRSVVTFVFAVALMLAIAVTLAGLP